MSPQEGPAWPARADLRVLDKETPRVDGPDKVRGAARYAHDVRLPGMVYARLLLCPHPTASYALDLAPALALPGVVDAIDLGSGATRFLGEPIAAVAAETPEQAEDAVRAIAATYEPGDWALDFEQALAPGAPEVRRGGNVGRESDNGDLAKAEAALEDCAATVEATYTLPVQHHVCLETHGMVVDWRGEGEAILYASTQSVSALASSLADTLELPASRVRTITDHMGGGFGSKFGPGPEGRAAALLAKRLERPVHLLLTRPAEFLMAGNRSGGVQAVRAGIDAEGRVRALVADISKLGGVSNGSNPGLPYAPYQAAIDTYWRHEQSVWTNLDGNRAMRAPGHPQASFAMESVLDELAWAVGLDPLEVRKKNLADPVWHRQLDRVAAEIGWADHPHRTRPGRPQDWTPDGIATGIGFGVSVWGGGGGPHDEVEVRVHRDGSVTASVGSQDLGTGTKTYVAGIVAEELGLALEQVTPRIGDSQYGRARGSGGSVTTAHLAPAVKDAAYRARLELAKVLAPVLGCEPDDVVFADGAVHARGAEGHALAWTDACAALGVDGIGAQGRWQPGLSSVGVHGAQAAKVEVDTLTGEVRVVKMVCMQDQGLPLNRMALRSQIHGGMIQALSYGLLEQRVVDAELGVMLTANLEDYKIAGCREIPELVALIDDADERGVIGMAEAPVIPGHGAIANAVQHACGVRVRDLPISCDKVLLGLAANARGGGR